MRIKTNWGHLDVIIIQNVMGIGHASAITGVRVAVVALSSSNLLRNKTQTSVELTKSKIL